MSNAHCHLLLISVYSLVFGNKASDTVQHLSYKTVCVFSSQKTELYTIQPIIRYIVISLRLVGKLYRLSGWNCIYIVKSGDIAKHILV